jgi:hypothetical protein
MLRTCLLVAVLSFGAAAVAGEPEAAPAQAPAPVGEETYIPFADNGGIRGWSYDKATQTILIEGRGKKWYRASFLGSCRELNFEHQIGFKSDPLGRVDRFSEIYLTGAGSINRTCQFKSLVRAEPPAKKKADKKGEKEEAAPAQPS